MSHNVYFKYRLGQRVDLADNRVGNITMQVRDTKGICYEVTDHTSSGIPRCTLIDEDRIALIQD